MDLHVRECSANPSHQWLKINTKYSGEGVGIVVLTLASYITEKLLSENRKGEFRRIHTTNVKMFDRFDRPITLSDTNQGQTPRLQNTTHKKYAAPTQQCQHTTSIEKRQIFFTIS
jgi:hypothetical protein